MKPLTKSVIVIWSEGEPCPSMSFEDIGREADEGAYYASHMSSETVDNPEEDEHWHEDLIEFFGDEEGTDVE